MCGEYMHLVGNFAHSQMRHISIGVEYVEHIDPKTEYTFFDDINRDLEECVQHVNRNIYWQTFKTISK